MLAAIRATPDDNTLRLAYADWLDESGDRGDLDAATAEFARLDCARLGRDGRPHREIAPAAAAWLLGPRALRPATPRAENWKRLVPSLLAVDRAHHGPGLDPIGLRVGRRVSIPVCLPSPYQRGPMVRCYALDLEFTRGFLAKAIFYSAYAAGLLLEPLHNDQPLVEIEIKGLRVDRAMGLLARLEEVAGEGAAKKFLARCA